jgi:hypothetical protein
MTQLETLADAAQLIANLEPYCQARPVWDKAASKILRAAATGEKPDIEAATRILEVALRREKWFR